MNRESVHRSPTFWARQGLVDSLSECITGGESKKELDLEGDPFFELETWFIPEQSLIRPLELPTEEELASRLGTAPEFLWSLVCQGTLTGPAYEQVMAENDMGPYKPQAETVEPLHGGIHVSHLRPFSTGQLAIMGFHISDSLT